MTSMKSSKIIFIADFFRDSLLGGAESNDHVLISALVRDGFDVTKVRSNDVNSEFILKNCDKKYIVSNFVGLSNSSKDTLASCGCDYIIYEHDHKYVSTRDPSKFVDYNIPNSHIINKGFYESAAAVVVLSSVCKDVIEKNLKLSNVHSIGCSLWTDEKFSLLRELSKNEKSGTVILDSSNPTKGTKDAEKVCLDRELEYEAISSPNEKEFLEKLSSAERLVFIPQVLETFCRLVAEAKMLGCKVLTKKSLIGFASEECFSLEKEELIDELVRRNKAAIDLFKNILSDTAPDRMLVEPVTAVLLTWKREESTKQLVDQAFEDPIIDEVILWNNNPDVEYTRDSLGHKNKSLTIVNSSENKITFGRYRAAMLSKNRLVYVQDDDWSMKDLQTIYNNYLKVGSDILSVVPSTHIEDIPRNKFVGWGSIFDKKCLSVFENYIKVFGEDLILHREADLLFTNANNYKKLETKPKLLVPDDGRSLSFEHGHHEYHRKMIERVKRLQNEG